MVLKAGDVRWVVGIIVVVCGVLLNQHSYFEYVVCRIRDDLGLSGILHETWFDV